MAEHCTVCTTRFPLWGRTCLVFLLLTGSATYFVLPFISPFISPPNIYALGPGFPIKRLEPSSSEFKPISFQSGRDRALNINDSVPWINKQQWKTVATTNNPEHSLSRYPYCNKLIENDEEEIARAKQFMNEHHRVVRRDEDYIRDTRNCARFVRERGYILDSSEKEKEFPIAFSIVFYTDLEQAERLLRATYRPHNFYCLHVDKKSSPSIREAAKGLTSCLQNVFLSSRSVSVEWGQFSVLEPELICMQDLWKYKRWRYFINLTGQEFPLKTNLQLVEILTALNGSNDVDCTTNRRDSGRWYNNFRAPHNIQPRKGNLHITASRGFVDYVLHNPVAKDFEAWVNLTDVPDETFFATMNHNPHLHVPGSYLGPPNTDAFMKPYLSRFKNWGHNWKDSEGRMNFNWPCLGKRVRTICIFGVGDLPSLTSRKEFFANKFHIDFEPLVLDCLEEWLWNMTMDGYSGRAEFDASFYRQLNIAHNHVQLEGYS
ncbi:beta-1,3-galactosyl-O-glycosyl-glycoprotein beta-1,6-N-acetylglucosaminyltransferase-like [Littorina saxatilis]|uniref:beta-1,3-galactosyl-O-glycosyl-glycoprotein beta-1,6-N-acetylglucosaminyltransferase-like n=1 Tax=Littorina saxatilis TaxID=31220 RepID=UPI0038B5E742